MHYTGSGVLQDQETGAGPGAGTDIGTGAGGEGPTTCDCGRDCDCDRGCRYGCDCGDALGTFAWHGERDVAGSGEGDRTWSRNGRWSRSRWYWPSATAAATANATAAVTATATAATPILVPVVPAVHPGCRPMVTAFVRPALHGHVLVSRPGVLGETETLSICSAQRAGRRTTCGPSPCTTMSVGKNTFFGESVSREE